jgi:hypothetical protein
VTEDEARAKSAQVDCLLMRIEQRLVELPPGVDIVASVQFDGKPPAGADYATATAPEAFTLGNLRDRYLVAHKLAKESNTLDTKGTHFRQLIATLGERYLVAELRPADLQRHIVRRVKASIPPVTARKENGTFRTAWNSAKTTGLLADVYPDDGLVYPKSDERPPFQTRQEIERRIRRGGLSEEEQGELRERVTGRLDTSCCCTRRGCPIRSREAGLPHLAGVEVVEDNDRTPLLICQPGILFD